MRKALFALLLLPVLALAGTAPTSQPAPQPRAALRGADCLDPDLARGWHYVDSEQLLVDAGRRHYRVHLGGGCMEIGSSAEISFHGDAVSGRVCGHAGETVRARGASCRIERIELIDRAEYDRSLGQGKASVEATVPVK